VAEPIYVSETVARTMNATFRRLDLEACGPGIMRSDRVVVKVWVGGEKIKGWRLLVEMDVRLGGLQCLGKNVRFADMHGNFETLIIHPCASSTLWKSLCTKMLFSST